MNQEVIYSIIGGGGLQHGLTTTPPNPPVAKFASQGDAPMRTNTQIKLLYYPLFFERVFLYLTGNYLWLTDSFILVPFMEKLFIKNYRL